MRERWFGATGVRVPEIALDGTLDVPLDDVLVLDDVGDGERLREAHEHGTPIVVRASDAAAVERALERPEVACVLVPADRPELLDLDLRRLKYG